MNTQEIKTLLVSSEYDFLRENKNLGNNIILLTPCGSHGRGIEVEGSDLDIRGIAIERPQVLIGLDKFERTNDKDMTTDTVIYGFRKAVKMMLECNPNIIEMFGTRSEQVFICNKYGQILKDNINLFLSKMVIQSFGCFAQGELRKAEINKYGMFEESVAKARKNIALSISLLSMGAEILEGKGVHTYREKEIKLLKDIRAGLYNFDEAFQISKIYGDNFRYAVENTDLPDEPYYDRIEEIMMEIYRGVMVDEKYFN